MLKNDEKSLRQLIAAAVKGGYAVSVFDGAEWALKRSTNEAAIFEAATGVDEAALNIWKSKGGGGAKWLGWMLLVYGNDEETVVADHVVNPELEALYNASLVKNGGVIMTDLNVTLRDIRRARPCAEGWTKLLKHVGDMADDAPLPLLTILESNGIEDTLWVVDNVGGQEVRDKLKPFLDACVLRACDHAERVLPKFEKRCPDDKRPRKAIEAARGKVAGTVSREACYDAADAANATANATAYAANATANAANATANATAYAANATAYAANATAYAANAAYAAAYAANAAAYAAYAAAYAAYAAANVAAYDAAAAAAAYAAANEREWQAKELRRFLTSNGG